MANRYNAAAKMDDWRCEETLRLGATEIRCKLDWYHIGSHVYEIDGKQDAIATSPPSAAASKGSTRKEGGV
jgi:hypothetical protein